MKTGTNQEITLEQAKDHLLQVVLGKNVDRALKIIMSGAQISLKRQPQNVAPESNNSIPDDEDEYPCPLCGRLANSVSRIGPMISYKCKCGLSFSSNYGRKRQQ